MTGLDGLSGAIIITIILLAMFLAADALFGGR